MFSDCLHQGLLEDRSLELIFGWVHGFLRRQLGLDSVGQNPLIGQLGNPIVFLQQSFELFHGHAILGRLCKQGVQMVHQCFVLLFLRLALLKHLILLKNLVVELLQQEEEVVLDLYRLCFHELFDLSLGQLRKEGLMWQVVLGEDL